MTAAAMPRKKVSFRLDERVINELGSLVGDGSVNQFVEGLLFEILKSAGRLPKDAERLPENRGGAREGSGKPKGYRSKTTEAAALTEETPAIGGTEVVTTASEPTQSTEAIEEETLDPG